MKRYHLSLAEPSAERDRPPKSAETSRAFFTARRNPRAAPVGPKRIRRIRETCLHRRNVSRKFLRARFQ